MEFRTQLAFHATGKRSGSLEPIEGTDLTPALFAGYRDLTKLRYDFPLVLIQPKADESWMRSLMDVVDGILQKIAPRGVEGERVRRQVLRLEQEIRRRAAEDGSGSLSAHWDEAAAALAAKSNEDLRDSFQRAREALDIDGEVLDCNAAMPPRLVTHAWRIVQNKRLRTLAQRIERLVLKLADVLTADFVRSASGRTPTVLAAAIGPILGEAFDFNAMSRLLGSAAAKNPFPESGRRRIERTLAVLRAQSSLKIAREPEGYDDLGLLRDYVFNDCDAALAAYYARLPAIVELVKAIAIAELELEGRYIEAEHDPFFESFDHASLGSSDLALFPDFLVCIDACDSQPDQRAGVMAILSSGLPIKVLVQTDDILGGPRAQEGAFTFAGARLGTMAIGLNDVYVLQSSAANLYSLRDRILRGLTFPGPALFSVFSGAGKNAVNLPPYLSSAAAMQSRTFPAFAYDPSAGADFAARFSLEENPQPAADWPTSDFTYEDEEHQRVSQDIAFTFVDFVASDRRYAHHFARIARGKGNGALVPVGEWLAADPGAIAEKVPYVLMVDHKDKLHRSITDEALTHAARRCRDMWHHLQELGGIHNSHAERLLAKEKQAWEEQRQREIATAKAGTAAARVLAPTPAASIAIPATVPAAADAPAAAEFPAAQDKPTDEPYIETLRCTSCNECTQINNRMFVYDENKQAFIADPNAGTYRQLVEAAESCQVCIIHPGKPRNPNEPDLQDLMKRAEPFN